MSNTRFRLSLCDKQYYSVILCQCVTELKLLTSAQRSQVFVARFGNLSKLIVEPRLTFPDYRPPQNNLATLNGIAATLKILDVSEHALLNEFFHNLKGLPNLRSLSMCRSSAGSPAEPVSIGTVCSGLLQLQSTLTYLNMLQFRMEGETSARKEENSMRLVESLSSFRLLEDLLLPHWCSTWDSLGKMPALNRVVVTDSVTCELGRSTWPEAPSPPHVRAYLGKLYEKVKDFRATIELSMAFRIDDTPTSLLSAAVAADNSLEAEWMLEHADLNETFSPNYCGKNSDQPPPLAMANNSHMVKRLIEAGANVNAIYRTTDIDEATTPLATAIRALGTKESVTSLIKAGANPLLGQRCAIKEALLSGSGDLALMLKSPIVAQFFESAPTESLSRFLNDCATLDDHEYPDDDSWVLLLDTLGPRAAAALSLPWVRPQGGLPSQLHSILSGILYSSGKRYLGSTELPGLDADEED